MPIWAPDQRPTPYRPEKMDVTTSPMTDRVQPPRIRPMETSDVQNLPKDRTAK